MRALVGLRSLFAVIAVTLTAACDQPPSSPDGSSVVPIGAVVLRTVFQSSCNGGPGVPEVRTRVTVALVGSEWVGTAGSAASGDVEVRFHEVGSTAAGSSVAGTIKGTAIHLPELISAPAWDGRINFGSDGRTSLTGVTFAANPVSPTNSVDGSGSGAIVLSDGAGHSCQGSSFSWSIFAPAS